MKSCPRCGAYYPDTAAGFCLVDGAPLVNVNPGSESWNEGARAIEQRNKALLRKNRRLKWRRIALTMMALLITSRVIYVVAVKGYVYTPPPTSTPTPTPTSTQTPIPTQTPTPTATSTPTPTATPTPVLYKITVRVTSPVGTSGQITLQLDGGKTESTVAGENGNHTFKDLTGNLPYTITPVAPMMVFDPPSWHITKLTRDEKVNFITRRDLPPVFYQISGRVSFPVGMAGRVKLKLEGGDKPDSTTTDADGNYSFKNLPAGRTYTITPVSPGMGFTPTYWREKLNRDEQVNFRFRQPTSTTDQPTKPPLTPVPSRPKPL